MIQLWRTLTVFAVAALVLASSWVGIAGMVVAAKLHFGIVLDTAGVVLTLPELVLGCMLMSIGAVLGGCGALFVVVLPLEFVFPDLTKPPSWLTRHEARGARTWAHRLFAWYATELKRYVDRNDV